MALSIKGPEADRLARELAAATGESLTEAVTKALRDRLRVARPDKRSEAEFLADIRKIVDNSNAIGSWTGPTSPCASKARLSP
jgi:antitoxin VapB